MSGICGVEKAGRLSVWTLGKVEFLFAEMGKVVFVEQAVWAIRSFGGVCVHCE